MKTKTIEISKNLIQFNNSMFPLYLIVGEKNSLIDCSVLSRYNKIRDFLKQILQTIQLNYVFFTHSHYDHVGSCSILQNEHNFSIFCSQRTKEILQNIDAIHFINDMNQKFKALEKDSSDTIFEMPKNLVAVEEKDRIPLGNDQYLQVYETPGHTKCSLSFFLEPNRVLFCGDATGVIERDGKVKPLFLSSYQQYVESIKKLLTIHAEILALPHNNCIKGEKRVQSFLKKAISESERIQELIFRYLKQETPAELIANELLSQEFPFATIISPREAMFINMMAMIRTIKREFPIRRDVLNI